MTDERACEFCGESLNRKSYEGARDWNRRRFCGLICSNKYAVLARGDRLLTQDDTQLIKENYGKIPANQIAQTLNRNIGSIEQVARKLGLTNHDCYWSSKENEVLLQQYPKFRDASAIRKLSVLLPRRSVNAIQHHARVLGLSVSRDSATFKVMRRMNATKTNSVSRLHKWRKNNVELNLKHSIRNIKEWRASHPEEVTRMALDNAKRKPLVIHNDHFHRSKREFRFCEKLIRLYDAGRLRANVVIGNAEVDWVLLKDTGGNPREPRDWETAFEDHAIRYWEGETDKTYRERRVAKLRNAGVLCPIIITTIGKYH